jgi:central glycolytic genes regulator
MMRACCVPPGGDRIVNAVLSQFRRLVPEMVDTARTRFEILEAVSLMAPVGRRALASHLDLPERAVRGEADKLKDLGLILFAPDGMHLTDEGTEVLGEIRAGLDLLFAEPLAERIRSDTGISSVMVVSGDSVADEVSRRALYRKTMQYLSILLRDGMTLAIMGGSTMAGVASQAQVGGRGLPNLMVVPARGGLGEEMEIQANTIAARLARGLGARHKLLHWPDDMPADSLPVMADGRFGEWLDSVRHADVLLYSVGRSEEMAKRRNLPADVLARIRAHGAVAEALGYYFDRKGAVVYAASGLGLELESLLAIKKRILVAGGAAKAEAVLAVARGCKPTAMILDETVAFGVCGLLDSRQ